MLIPEYYHMHTHAHTVVSTVTTSDCLHIVVVAMKGKGKLQWDIYTLQKSTFHTRVCNCDIKW